MIPYRLFDVCWNLDGMILRIHLREGTDAFLTALTETGAFHIERLRLNRPPLVALRRARRRTEQYHDELMTMREEQSPEQVATFTTIRIWTVTISRWHLSMIRSSWNRIRLLKRYEQRNQFPCCCGTHGDGCGWAAGGSAETNYRR